MLRPHGYNRIEGGPEGLIEEDTVRCVHNQEIGFVQPGGLILWPQFSPIPQEQYTCRQCYSPICPGCANKPCRHFEKWLERMESKSGAIRSNLDRLAEIADKAARMLGL
jgi:hypothetical protein